MGDGGERLEQNGKGMKRGEEGRSKKLERKRISEDNKTGKASPGGTEI